MNTKESTGHGKAEGKAAQKPRAKRNLTKALYASDEEFRSIFDESPIGIELYDSDGLLMDANQACLRMLGVSDIAQVKGFKLFEDPNLPGEAKAKLRRGKPVRYEAPFDFEKVKELRLYETSKSGIVHLDVLITPVGVKRKAAPQGYLVQVQDITERKQTEESLRHRAEELAALQATVLDLAAQQDLLSLLHTIVERAMALLHAPGGFIYLYDATRNDLEMTVTQNFPAPIGTRLQMGKGMAGQVAQTRQPLIVDDYSTWEGRSPLFADTPYHAIVEVPMLFSGQLIGVLGVNDTAETALKFTQADTRLLSLFAGQAASAVHNARLVQGLQSELTERKRAEEALRESEERSRRTLDNMMEGCQIIGFDWRYLYVNDAATRHGYQTREALLGHTMMEVYPGIENTEMFAALRRCMNERTSHQMKNEFTYPDGTKAWFELSIQPVPEGIFILSIDITARKRAEKAREITHQISQAAVSTESLEELYHSIHELLGELMPVENFYIALYEPSNDLLSFPYFVDQYDQPPPPQKPGRGLTEYVLRSGQPLLASPDIFAQLAKQGKVDARGTDSVDWLGVPLKVKEQVIGVMVTQSYTEGIRFSQEDADLLTFVSTQVAMAIERKRAEEQVRRHAERLSILNRIARAISTTLNLDELLEIVYQEITSAIKTEAFFIALYDPTENDLDFRILEDKGIREPPERRPLGTGLTAQVITSKRPLLIRNSEQEKELLPPIELWGTQEMPQSWLGVPMLLGDKIIGVISVQAYNPNAYGDNEQELFSTIADTVAVAIENVHLYTSLGNEKQRLELLYNLSHHLTESLDSHQVATKALDHICTALGAFKGVIYVPRPQIDRWELLAAVGLKPIAIETFNQNADVPLTSGLIGWTASHKKTAIVPDVVKDKRWETIPGLDVLVRSALSVPLLAGNTIVGVLSLLSDQIAAFREEDVEIVQAAAASVAVALQNARLYAAEKRRAERLAAISKLSTEIAALHEASPVLNILVTRAAALMESTTCTVMLIDTATNEAVLAAQTGLPPSTPAELRVPLELPILRHSLESGEPIIIPDIDRDVPAMRSVLVRPDVRAFFAYPMIHQGQVMGFITFSKLTLHTPSAEEIAACQLLAERAAVALENARLFEETARSLRQVQALHTIDITIASSFDLRLTLNIFLDQTRTQLGVDAVEILVYNPHTQMLDYAAGIGFRTTALQGTHMRLGQGYAGIAGLERKTIRVSNLREHKTDFLRSPNFKAEEFDTYFGVPLIAKGQVKGVLEVFHRSPLQPDQNWMDFMETLGKQAAIGIDNATLFSDLQSSNAELMLAYDTTLSGWSKALDLRDRETEGHTQRVVETTVRLARAMGVSEAELANVRRGALLHDIGKMGVPDDILHKPGPLTAEEWATMRQHPVYAREMLSPIAYLRPAMDIPYYHHEKWDGSGYPNGLKGEQIPLAARVFAVVDVFDALTSDRPYRSAWPREEALEYIREQAGKHFDPAVVEMFLRMVEV
jgi:PAS domain S-box-containing protein